MDSASSSPMEICNICTNIQPKTSFISPPGCEHVYCITCLQSYAKSSLGDGRTNIKCAAYKCNEKFEPNQFNKIMSPASLEILMTRQAEASIPPMLRVYYPFKDCSVVMEKSCNNMELVECVACHRGFCAKCISPWHDNMTCSEKAKESDDKEFLYLAKNKKWRACNMCHQMIELRSGCIEIKCTCGNGFCYVCGANWDFEYENFSRFQQCFNVPHSQCFATQLAKDTFQGLCNMQEGRGSMLDAPMMMQQNVLQNQHDMQQNGLEVSQNVQGVRQDIEKMQRDMQNMQQVVETTRKYVQNMQQRKMQMEVQNEVLNMQQEMQNMKSTCVSFSMLHLTSRP